MRRFVIRLMPPLLRTNRFVVVLRKLVSVKNQIEAKTSFTVTITRSLENLPKIFVLATNRNVWKRRICVLHKKMLVSRLRRNVSARKRCASRARRRE